MVEASAAPAITSESADKVIILGSGAAALSAAEAYRARNKNADIELLSKASDKPYYRPAISDYLSEDIIDDDFYLKTHDWYETNNVKLTLNTLVDKIDTNAKEVVLGNGEIRAYDKLILATGSRANVPRILGVEHAGCFTLRGVHDANRIKEYTKEAKKSYRNRWWSSGT
jgi:NAD(P)H-nitrite reductase large subunit